MCARLITADEAFSPKVKEGGKQQPGESEQKDNRQTDSSNQGSKIGLLHQLLTVPAGGHLRLRVNTAASGGRHAGDLLEMF